MLRKKRRAEAKEQMKRAEAKAEMQILARHAEAKVEATKRDDLVEYGYNNGFAEGYDVGVQGGFLKSQNTKTDRSQPY